VSARARAAAAISLIVALAAGAGLARAEIAQQGKLRVTVTGKLSPRTLPRRGTAPIAVFVGGHISTTDGSAPPQLKGMRIEFNRLGRLESRGLPVCRPSQIQPASSARALAACRGSLVGEGSFRANIVLSGQAPYPTKGRLLVFNGARHGKPVLLGQIYAAKPFATSFLIPFAVRHVGHGTYGTALTASLPRALGSWGYLTAISLRLSRRYAYRGAPRSFISAGCPAPAGFPGAVFALARMRFSFAGGRTLSSTLTRSCGARG
jgi:hypothetical protein